MFEICILLRMSSSAVISTAWAGGVNFQGVKNDEVLKMFVSLRIPK